MELEKLTEQVKTLLHAHVEPSTTFRPGKISIWIKPIRHAELDGSRIEESVGPVQKLLHDVLTHEELVHLVAEHVLLSVFGAEAPMSTKLPNLVVKFFDRKVYIQVPDAPPLDDGDQTFVKVTVYAYEPGLWERLFGKEQ